MKRSQIVEQNVHHLVLMVTGDTWEIAPIAPILTEKSRHSGADLRQGGGRRRWRWSRDRDPKGFGYATPFWQLMSERAETERAVGTKQVWITAFRPLKERGRWATHWSTAPSVYLPFCLPPTTTTVLGVGEFRSQRWVTSVTLCYRGISMLHHVYLSLRLRINHLSKFSFQYRTAQLAPIPSASPSIDTVKYLRLRPSPPAHLFSLEEDSAELLQIKCIITHVHTDAHMPHIQLECM